MERHLSCLKQINRTEQAPGLFSKLHASKQEERFMFIICLFRRDLNQTHCSRQLAVSVAVFLLYWGNWRCIQSLLPTVRRICASCFFFKNACVKKLQNSIRKKWGWVVMAFLSFWLYFLQMPKVVHVLTTWEWVSNHLFNLSIFVLMKICLTITYNWASSL